VAEERRWDYSYFTHSTMRLLEQLLEFGIQIQKVKFGESLRANMVHGTVKIYYAKIFFIKFKNKKCSRLK